MPYSTRAAEVPLPTAVPTFDRVSVIVPTRNSARTLEQCLKSVRAQSHRDVELIVVDNHSTDGTLAIARRNADRMIVRGPERSAQRNLGAALATGEFVLFVDSDMLLSPDVAEQVARSFRTNSRMQALVVPEQSIGIGFWAQCRALEKDLYLGDTAVEAARAFRRSAFWEAGGYDERLVGGEDWDLSERIAVEPQNLGRVEAVIVHDEGRLRLRETLRKKFYYGETLYRYARAHPDRVMGKIVRKSFFRGWRLIARDPVRASGLVILRVLEFGAVGAGAARSVVRAERRSDCRGA